jgi:sterol desaturase/sphingolipid hydroxylase (fatty acid hydroxylase superfamily)
VINIFIVGPLIAFADCAVDFQFKMDMESIPEVSTMIWQIGLFILAGEVTFYWIHRLMHHPNLYWIHK